VTGLALAFLAGSLTLLNPCVLPLLPIVVGSAFQAGRLGPLALTAGLSLSFAVFGTAITAFGFALGISVETLRLAGAALLLAMGTILLLPRAQAALATAAGPMTSHGGELAGRIDGSTPAGQFGLGLVSGIVWSPCVGPTLGAAIGAAAGGADLLWAALTMLVFALGTSAALLLFAYGSRQALATKRRAWSDAARYAKPIMGGGLVLVGLLVLSGLDKRLEALAVEAMPDWLIGLTTRF